MTVSPKPHPKGCTHRRLSEFSNRISGQCQIFRTSASPDRRIGHAPLLWLGLNGAYNLLEQEDPILTYGAVALALGGGIALAFALSFLLPPVAAIATAALAAAMALVTYTDLRHYVIPDVISLPVIPLGLAAKAAVFHDGDWLAGVTESIAAAALALGLFGLLRLAYSKLRGVEGLGLGDVKLAAVAGAWLGLAPLAPACLTATLAALLGTLAYAAFHGRRPDDPAIRVPFGSFIAPVIVLYWSLRLWNPGLSGL